ncbi:MAG TPA: FHA domain-containing protein [Kofleriaceae bacterium]|nr:FHA domain-containing protein [Kofleriaceae bacterium]
MFLKYFDFVFAPFRAINNKIFQVRNIKGNIQVDINRAKSLGLRGKNAVGRANDFNNRMMGQPSQQGAQMQQAGQPPGMPGMPPGMPGMPPGMPGMAGAPGAPLAPNPNPPIIKKGFWIFAKNYCSQCEQQLDKSWPSCPFCQQIAAQVVASASPAVKMKTQAFVIDASGGPSSLQLLGWIVPLQGPQRGELFTLSPVTVVGTDPACNLVLQDKFMSSRHAEIKAENGLWILRDSGSTNGTYVNNRRIDRHELVDNDFIKFGSALLKFKSL